jgi:hypothetical protein
MSLHKELMNVYYSISGSIDHGECFYDKNMLKSFLSELDALKLLAQKLYEKNQQERDDE